MDERICGKLKIIDRGYEYFGVRKKGGYSPTNDFKILAFSKGNHLNKSL